MGKAANHVRGERHHRARLTETDVARMRALHYDWDICVRCVAKLYETKYATAWDAINYNTWKHVQ